MVDITATVIGNGVIGAAISFELTKKGIDHVVLEESPKSPLENQSSRNSGVIHAGIYYDPEISPNKARFCRPGSALLYDFCQEHQIPHKQTGKLLIATSQQELPYIQQVERHSKTNKVPGVKWLDSNQTKELEPNVQAISSLYVPTSGIIDSTSLVNKLRFLSQGMHLYKSTLVGIQANPHSFTITSDTHGQGKENFETRYVFNAAGLHSAKIARLLTLDFPYKMEPVRGESAKFYNTRRPSIATNGHNLYPAPHGCTRSGIKLNIPFEEYKKRLEQGDIISTLGVHLTPTLSDTNPSELGKTVTIGPYYQTGKTDLVPPSFFLARVKSFFPHLQESDIEFHQAGIQAKLQGHYDWVIEPDAKHPRFINLVGIDSPGLTSSLAIAKYVVDNLLD